MNAHIAPLLGSSYNRSCAAAYSPLSCVRMSTGCATRIRVAAGQVSTSSLWPAAGTGTSANLILAGAFAASPTRCRPCRHAVRVLQFNFSRYTKVRWVMPLAC